MYATYKSSANGNNYKNNDKNSIINDGSKYCQNDSIVNGEKVSYCVYNNNIDQNNNKYECNDNKASDNYVNSSSNLFRLL